MVTRKLRKYLDINPYSFSWGPWPCAGEIFSTRIREPGVAFGVGFQWLFIFDVFPTTYIQQRLGGICCCSWVAGCGYRWVHFCLEKRLVSRPRRSMRCSVGSFRIPSMGGRILSWMRAMHRRWLLLLRGIRMRRLMWMPISAVDIELHMLSRLLHRSWL
jgi:hypothetical protein